MSYIRNKPILRLTVRKSADWWC